MLFREIVPVYCESDSKHVTTTCGENAETFNVKTSGA